MERVGEEKEWVMACKRVDLQHGSNCINRLTCPLVVGRSKDSGVLLVDGVARVHTIQCETRVYVVLPDTFFS